jgi:poly-gamma-glutamate synthesis protein (capsule biosynthesis protein)
VTPPAVTQLPSKARVVTLAFAGDVHFQAHLAALLDHPRGAMGPIAKTLRAADLAMVNLESAVTTGGVPAAKELESSDQRYWFRTSPGAFDVLADAGVDVVTMANNHGADYGPAGVADSLRAARGSSVAVVGIGRNRAEAFTPFRTTIDDTDIAVLAADASPLESRSPVWSAGPGTAGLAAAHSDQPRALLSAVRAAAITAEVVIVYLHWGAELYRCPTPQQVATARALAAAGADVVVGSHAHVLLGTEQIGDTYVDYGLGNFVWYIDEPAETGVLTLRVRNGRVVSDGWVPARIGSAGIPMPVHGPARTEAVERWRHGPECSGVSAALPPFTSSVSRIGPAQQARMRSSHGPGCPMRWSDLRLLRLDYVGFDGRAHSGELVVAAKRAPDVARVFARLYHARWPIRRMQPVSVYGGDDERSMAADNTSSYNCRRVAASTSWSDHAYGAAVDLNPVENPYLLGGTVHPAAARRYLRIDRGGPAPAPGVITADSIVVKAFAAIGWEWGGNWAEPDYQHFAAPSG